MFNFNCLYNTTELKRFFCPSKIIAGKNSKDTLCQIINNKSKIVIFIIDDFFKTDSFVLGILNNNSFKKRVIYVKNEPTSDFIEKVLKKVPSKFDYLVVIGGGSSVDVGKAVLANKLYKLFKSVGYGLNRELVEFFDRKKITFICIPTTAGSGSEASRYYLLIDSKTREKTVNRSSSLFSDYILLDPYFLKNAPKDLIVCGAFDAFVHLWETYICKYERSDITDIFIYDGIFKILFVMDLIKNDVSLDDNKILDLQYAAMYGGISLSNVRTGFMHDAGESLSAQVKISHPISLYVFFEESMLSYKKSIENKEKYLIDRLNLDFGFKKFKSIDDVIKLWSFLFDKFGMTSKIKKLLKENKINSEPVVEKIFSDKVLIEKENPINLSKEEIDKIIKNSLNKFK